METCPASTSADFRRDLSAATEDVQRGVSAGRSAAGNTQWDKWVLYTTQLGLDPFLTTIKDKVPILQVFLRRVRFGKLSAQGRQIKSRSAEDYLRTVAQTYLTLGSDDPRSDSDGKVDFRLRRMLKAYAKEDPAPNRVKPVPVPVLHHILSVASTTADPLIIATADMICIAFFFLLRPGEYTVSPAESTPFELKDVQFFMGQRRLDINTALEAEILSATFASLTFDKQKNSVRGEVIGHAPSGHLSLCAVRAIGRRVLHLRSHNALPSTPLASAFTATGLQHVKPSQITDALRMAVQFLGPSLGFLPTDVSARCLRAAGANALLCGGVDTDVIRLLGRWRSDEMLRYLHTQANPLIRTFSRQMLAGGTFTLIPNQLVPVNP